MDLTKDMDIDIRKLRTLQMKILKIERDNLKTKKYTAKQMDEYIKKLIEKEVLG